MFDFGFATAVGQKTVMANLVESFRQNVPQKPSNKLLGLEGRGLPDYSVCFIVFIPEVYFVILNPDDSLIADGNSMGIAPDVTNHLFGVSKRRFTIHNPIPSYKVINPTFKIVRF
jgi:hypothetical protein